NTRTKMEEDEENVDHEEEEEEEEDNEEAEENCGMWIIQPRARTLSLLPVIEYAANQMTKVTFEEGSRLVIKPYTPPSISNKPTIFSNKSKTSLASLQRCISSSMCKEK